MSSNAGYTKGPWLAKTDMSHFDSLSTIEAGGRTDKWPNIRMIVQVGGSAGLAEQEANTRLIAAAPELLEACKDAAILLGEMGHKDLVTAIDLRAAIAKAEGGSK